MYKVYFLLESILFLVFCGGEIMVSTLCRELSPLLQLIGQCLNIFKISLPLILIIIGIFDIGKVAISNKSEDIKKNMKNLFYRIAVAIVVFFIPTLCMVVFGFVGKFDEVVADSGIDYETCYDCLFRPSKENCCNAVKTAEEHS